MERWRRFRVFLRHPLDLTLITLRKKKKKKERRKNESKKKARRPNIQCEQRKLEWALKIDAIPVAIFNFSPTHMRWMFENFYSFLFLFSFPFPFLFPFPYPFPYPLSPFNAIGHAIATTNSSFYHVTQYAPKNIFGPIIFQHYIFFRVRISFFSTLIFWEGVFYFSPSPFPFPPDETWCVLGILGTLCYTLG